MGWNDGANLYEAGEYAKAITTLKVRRPPARAGKRALLPVLIASLLSEVTT